MSDSAIAAAPLVADVAPYVLDLAGALIPIAVGWLAKEMRAYTGVQVKQTAIDMIDKMAKAEAGTLIAAAADNLASRQIPMSSPMVADAAVRIIHAAPRAFNDCGLTPGHVAVWVAGHIGNMQANMTVAPPGLAPVHAGPVT